VSTHRIDVNGDVVTTTAKPETGSAPPPRRTEPPRTERPRTAVRRLPEKQVQDRGALDTLLDTALVAHVAVLEESDGRIPARQYVVPVSFVRDHDQVLMHGSTASRAFRALAAGQPTCLTVTVVDGIVVARSQFESSMRYRSAMVFGSCEVLHGRQKAASLARLAARLLPGLEGARPPSEQELTATAVLALPLEEWSVARWPQGRA
jgi:nitroimidazol reductase NimA-like FMN-containing flavoprotein (pyridoxamine 5'-phosphate oxidase superfamily)